MTYSPLSLSRRHILGELYSRCDSLIESVPVYLAGVEPELLGHADECLGHYADAISFHLADDVCKRLSSGQYTYSFDFQYSDPSNRDRRSRITLTSITLNARKGYDKPIPRSAASRLETAPEAE